jgi:hypothetical protein
MKPSSAHKEPLSLMVKTMHDDVPRFQKAGAIHIAPAALEKAREFASFVSSRHFWGPDRLFLLV